MARITKDGKVIGFTWDKEEFKKWLAEIAALQTFTDSYPKNSARNCFDKLYKSKTLKREDIEWHE